ncbi:hypothetical protein BJ980_002223 [Nocardioides daedukensis]|uniref:HNH endonuclease n=1 Tax=Nocardioides daedukensis TaxID=634462 RepID=A0A7Y9S4K8_9ACTN|nr:hypothetical protein [Nocardioides daedukensis]
MKPVIDLNDRISSNAYEHPEWLRERIHLTTPADPFPHATRISRHGDIDHCVPYRHDIPGRPAPPGQSGTHNAAPLGRYHHRVKTYLNYTVRQPRPGTHVWRTPHNRWLLVDERGTHRIDESLGHALTGRSQGEQHLALIIRDQNPGYGEVVGTQRGRSSSRSEDQR